MFFVVRRLLGCTRDGLRQTCSVVLLFSLLLRNALVRGERVLFYGNRKKAETVLFTGSAFIRSKVRHKLFSAIPGRVLILPAVYGAVLLQFYRLRCASNGQTRALGTAQKIDF